MTTDATNPTGAPATPATPVTPTTPEVPTLVPDSPEYRAEMIRRAEASQNPNGVPLTAPTPEGTTPPANVEKKDETPADPNAPVPKLTDTPEGDPPTTDDTPKEGDAPAYDFAKAFNDGSLVTEFSSEKPSEAMVGALAKALGITPEQATLMQAQFREGQVALQEKATGKLYEAAGGKDQFAALVQWGQKNLTPQQREYYDTQFNGPDAAEAVAFLTSRMNAGRDPALINVNGKVEPAVAGFRDQSEMVAAMRDPRYQESEAFRQEVANKLRVSRF